VRRRRSGGSEVKPMNSKTRYFYTGPFYSSKKKFPPLVMILKSFFHFTPETKSKLMRTSLCGLR